VLIAASCSKSFGIYRERTGILLAVGSPAQRETVQGTLAWLNRQNWSFPPDHGARLVTMILGDATLRTDWQAELDQIRGSMTGLRADLADQLRQVTGSDRFGFVAGHRGMFSRLGLTPAQVESLRRDHAIYMVGDSRINIAGLNAATVPVLARAIAAVGG
jgi:aromatic-amino-acid transaminase